jgi:D-arabinose 1-dehydrogenase-like Zn-dependent alcohol dehydrogenase
VNDLKAMVLKEVGRIELEELPKPKLGPNEIIVKVVYCEVLYDGCTYLTMVLFL